MTIIALESRASEISAKSARTETTARAGGLTRIPCITIHAFCETSDVAAAIRTAGGDRRMSRAHVKVHEGGIAAATEFYREMPTPNLVVVESHADATLTADLRSLAAVCSAKTKVVIVGYSNDIKLYRQLLDLGVDEYLVAPLDVMSMIGSISRIYGQAAKKLGQVCAFVGAKGGVGSSTVAHNVAWTMARLFGSDVILADMDLPFGTAGLDFNIDPTRGLVEALQDPARVDEMLLERLLAKRENHLKLLAAPLALDRSYDFDETAFEQMLDVGQSHTPFIVLDIPHVWTAWVKKTLLAADEVVITAAPDFANFRNAKCIVEYLKQARPNDAPPRLILNQISLPKRPEIKADDFAAALQIEPIAQIRFDAQLFGTAANNGQMIAEASSKANLSEVFANVAQIITTGRNGLKGRTGRFQALVDRLKFRRKTEVTAGKRA
jgi:pilus assembly protein CpaE